MIAFKSQTGMGLVEVMVSLLILAVVVLGFSSLQMQAVKATDESLTRSTAVSSVRNLSEDVRLNMSEKKSYHKAVADIWTGLSATDKSVTGYCTGVAGIEVPDCLNGTCTAAQQVTYNSYKSMKAVCDAGMMMNAIGCPQDGNLSPSFDDTPLPKLCLIISWDNTLPERKTDDSEENNDACIDSNGAYIPGSSCLVMETY